LSHYKNAGHSHNIKTANKSFKKCGKVQIFETVVTISLKTAGECLQWFSSEAFYHPAQLLSSHLLSNM